ncbi:MAG: Bax inhibitor-1/YccA family protein [Victivallaceae bacterium]|nr:Bax inhibitor-1/YccA family protein [Victivallaceae bacterium]
MGKFARLNDVASTAMTQSAFINKVFGWMSAGLAISGLTAWQFATNESCRRVLYGNPALSILLVLLTFGIVFGLSFAMDRISATMACCGFFAYSILNGMMLSSIFLVYEIGSVATAFGAGAVMFAIMGLYGMSTKRDLTAVGSLCTMGVIGLIVASLINIFFRSEGFSLIISFFGVAIFVGLTAYDTQKIKMLAASQKKMDGETGNKLAVIGALQLYLDFINLFLYLLRIFGKRK